MPIQGKKDDGILGGLGFRPTQEPDARRELNFPQGLNPHTPLSSFLGGSPDSQFFMDRATQFRRSLENRGTAGDGSIGDLLRQQLLPHLRFSREFGRDAYPLAMGRFLEMLANDGIDPERLASRQRSIGRDADNAIQASTEERNRTGVRAEAGIATNQAIRGEASDRRLDLGFKEEQNQFDRRQGLLEMFKQLFLNPSLAGLSADRAAFASRGQGGSKLAGYGALLGAVSPLFAGAFQAGQEIGDKNKSKDPFDDPGFQDDIESRP